MAGSRAVPFGVLLPTREALIFGNSDPAPLLDLAVQAESLGFASVWVGESLLARPRFEPLTLLAAVAARTSTITIGTAVLLPALHQAVPLAHAAATLDRIAHGRLILGVGAAGPKMLQRTGQSFDGWFPISATVEEFAAGLGEVRRAATAAGRNPRDVTAAVYLNVCIDADAAKAEADQRTYMETYYGAPFAVLKTMMGCCAGSAETVGNWIAAYVAAGAEHVHFARRPRATT